MVLGPAAADELRQMIVAVVSEASSLASLLYVSWVLANLLVP